MHVYFVRFTITGRHQSISKMELLIATSGVYVNALMFEISMGFAM